MLIVCIPIYIYYIYINYLGYIEHSGPMTLCASLDM